MKMFQRLGTLVACALLSGCLSSSSPVPMASEPPPSAPGVNDVMRVGDKVTVRLTGTPDDGYILEKEVSASGDITVPLLTQPFHAAGRTASDVAAEIATAYRVGQIYTNPNVTIIAEDRFVSIGGDVRNPNRVLYAPDLTVLGAINSCGGFTEYANRKAVRVTRGSTIFQVDCVAAQKGGADPPVFPGDEIYVPRTIL